MGFIRESGFIGVNITTAGCLRVSKPSVEIRWSLVISIIHLTKCPRLRDPLYSWNDMEHLKRTEKYCSNTHKHLVSYYYSRNTHHQLLLFVCTALKQPSNFKLTILSLFPRKETEDIAFFSLKCSAFVTPHNPKYVQVVRKIFYHFHYVRSVPTTKSC